MSFINSENLIVVANSLQKNAVMQGLLETKDGKIRFKAYIKEFSGIKKRHIQEQ